jgi:predicted nucleic acid-binding protein
MVRLIDTSLWIDLTRLRSPVALKTFVASFVNDADARLADPIAFELLRSATEVEARVLTEHFASMPKLTNCSGPHFSDRQLSYSGGPRRW